MATTNVAEAPQNILIIGAGVFGLSTALALLERPSYSSSRITVIDSAPTLPNPVGSSVDSSRIVRADYSLKPYATLATEAQELWRDTTPSGWGGEGRYHETGFVLTGDDGQEDYVRKAMQNVQELADGGETLDRDKIEELSDREAISKASGLIGVSGDRGYANWNSGWADAEASVAFALHKLRTHPQARSRVTIKANCKVTELLFTKTSNRQCTGVHLEDGSSISADLTILAAGAWTPSLFNLEYRCLATGQVIAYLQLTAQEQTYLENLPVIINFARGTFIIPPSRGELKIARHGYGYRNPQRLSPPSPSSDASPRFSESASISVPRTDTAIPIEAERTLRDALAELFPPTIPPHTETPPTYPTSLSTISTRPFTNTRICWYNDTPTSNFIIDYPPLSPDAASQNKSLLIATGGSGHGFKFFPILGKYIVDAAERNLAPEYAELWRWPQDDELRAKYRVRLGEHDGEPIQFIECEDGSRGGPRGMVLSDELAKGKARSGLAPKL